MRINFFILDDEMLNGFLNVIIYKLDGLESFCGM